MSQHERDIIAGTTGIHFTGLSTSPSLAERESQEQERKRQASNCVTALDEIAHYAQGEEVEFTAAKLVSDVIRSIAAFEQTSPTHPDYPTIRNNHLALFGKLIPQYGRGYPEVMDNFIAATNTRKNLQK